MNRVLFMCHGKIYAWHGTPIYTMLYHPLRAVDPICTTRLLLYKITTFCPNMTKITAASITEAAVLLVGVGGEKNILT